MSQTVSEESRMKELFKQALLEVLEERSDWFYALVVEAMEDIALARAIREGEKTELVAWEEVERALEEEP